MTSPFGRRMRRVDQYLMDALAWSIAVVLAVWLRYEFDLGGTSWLAMLSVCAVAAVTQLVGGAALNLYRRRFVVGSVDEVLHLAGSVLVTAFVMFAVIATLQEWFAVPRSTPLIAAPLAFLAMAMSRYLQRWTKERANRPTAAAEPVLVYGAGSIGSHLVRSMRSDVASKYNPVALVDDAPEKAHAVHSGVEVLGTSAQLAQIAKLTGATTVIVAIAHTDAAMLQRISADAADAGLRVLVMPPLNEVLDGRHGTGDLRDISIEDIVGRHAVDTDVETVAGYLTGRRVLVTGAGGSIGSELCRQINKFGPSELIMLDRDETSLQAVQIAVDGHGLLNTKDVVLADIRDAEKMREVMLERRPDVVFHAAALKHLPMLEQYPDEAWKTNVLGSLNVLDAAYEAEVGTFVNVSTDKAANATSVLGHSKRLAERLTASFAERSPGRYLSVRFGNVLGSRGSMLPTFAALIEAGGPLTVTHPDVTRYFMSIPEACQLVMHAGAVGRPGEVLILDMGEPVRILDVAQRMIRMSGKAIEIVFTGLRPHEKLHEELIGAGESDDRPSHDKITQARVDPLEPAALDKVRWDSRWDPWREPVDRADRHSLVAPDDTSIPHMPTRSPRSP